MGSRETSRPISGIQRHSYVIDSLSGSIRQTFSPQEPHHDIPSIYKTLDRVLCKAVLRNVMQPTTPETMGRCKVGLWMSTSELRSRWSRHRIFQETRPSSCPCTKEFAPITDCFGFRPLSLCEVLGDATLFHPQSVMLVVWILDGILATY